MSHPQSSLRLPGRSAARRPARRATRRPWASAGSSRVAHRVVGRVAGWGTCRVALGVILALAVAACGQGGRAGGNAQAPGPTGAPTTTRAASAAPACVKNEQGTGCLPLAPEGRRVDLAAPVFSRPTEITNPLLPVAEVAQSLQLGTVDGEPFRAEVTLLPGTKAITWNGRQVPARIHQYVAYSGGRILEVALDWYAQADDGSVWYFGEDVFNYEDGVVADTHGTWLAGRDGPPGMIMPANPRPGDVWRPENIPGLVFEQATAKATGQRVPGPRGAVDGALVVGELHMDGATEDKTFAPGYGEFSAGGGRDRETVALAVPVDTAGGPPPAELTGLVDGARAAFAASASGRWPSASAQVDAMAAAWTRIGGDQPQLLARQLGESLDGLAGAVGARDPGEAGQAALEAEQAALDLQLRHRPPAEVDLDRLDLWARQLLVDAAADERGAVAGDLATLRVIWDRSGRTADPAAARRVADALRALRAAAKEDPQRAAAPTRALRDALAQLRP
jgi:hypothetical protein